MTQHKENVLPQPASPAAFLPYIFAAQKENKESKK